MPATVARKFGARAMPPARRPGARAAWCSSAPPGAAAAARKRAWATASRVAVSASSRLFQRFARDQRALASNAGAPLAFARRLRKLGFGLAQRRLRFRARGTEQFLQRGVGLAHARDEIVGPQHHQQVAWLHAIAFLHAAFDHGGGDLAAHLHARGADHAAGGDHGLHQRLLSHDT